MSDLVGQSDGLTHREVVLDVLRQADLFAAKSLSAFIHKSGMLDCGRGRFDRGMDFLEAAYEIQQKIRIAISRIEERA